MQWHTVTQLGRHLHETREGYLVARDVVIARTGTQVYFEHEIPPLIGDAGGRVHVARDPDDVFDADSILSYNGKPICDDHPSELVGPDNWSDLSVGHVGNVRRGAAPNDDVLLADMMFTTRRAIQAVRSGKRAISVGYTANYDQGQPGVGRQKDIFCNHVALVDEGRCGSRCVILDGKPIWSDEAFVESEHPREPAGSAGGGQFTSAGGGGGSKAGEAGEAKETEHTVNLGGAEYIVKLREGRPEAVAEKRDLGRGEFEHRTIWERGKSEERIAHSANLAIERVEEENPGVVAKPELPNLSPETVGQLTNAELQHAHWETKRMMRHVRDMMDLPYEQLKKAVDDINNARSTIEAEMELRENAKRDAVSRERKSQPVPPKAKVDEAFAAAPAGFGKVDEKDPLWAAAAHGMQPVLNAARQAGYSEATIKSVLYALKAQGWSGQSEAGESDLSGIAAGKHGEAERSLLEAMADREAKAPGIDGRDYYRKGTFSGQNVISTTRLEGGAVMPMAGTGELERIGADVKKTGAEMLAEGYRPLGETWIQGYIDEHETLWVKFPKPAVKDRRPKRRRWAVRVFDNGRLLVDEGFSESEHPREPAGSSGGGQFTSGGGGGSHPIHTLEGAAEHLDKLRAKYPEADHGGKIEVRPDDLLGEDNYGTHRGGHIYLSPKHWNKEALEKHDKEWWGITHDATPEGIVTHEFGHAMHHKMEKLLDPYTVNHIIAKWVPEQNAITGDLTSPYGQDNIFEFMAEAFGVHATGKVSAQGGPFEAEQRRVGKGVWDELLEAARGDRLPKTPESARWIAGSYDLSEYTPERLRAAQAILAGTDKRGDGKLRAVLKKELAGRATGPAAAPASEGTEAERRDALIGRLQRGEIDAAEFSKRLTELGRPRDFRKALGGERIAYHATKPEFLSSIKQSGLKLKAPGRNFDDGLYQGERGESVYVTRELGEAAEWAQLIGGFGNRDMVILEVHVPEGHELKSDEKHGEGKAYRYAADIPPDWIKTVRPVEYDGGKSKIGEPTSFDAEPSGQPVFMVVAVGGDPDTTHDAVCACRACNPRKERTIMAGLRDLFGRAFVARDQTALEKIIDEAAKGGFIKDQAGHDEPDGDEGKQAIVIHNHHNEGGNGDDDDKKTGDTGLAGRVGKLEDGMKALDAKMGKILDAVSKRTKDADPDDPDKKTDDDGNPFAKKDDDPDKKTDDTDAGAATATDPPSADGELMEADPALKTGASKMGDAETKSRRERALAGVVRDCAARAELLSPGIKFAQLDAGGVADLKAIGGRLCALRRDALGKVATTDAAPQVLGRYTADAIKGLSCDAVRMLFVDASDRMRQLNNARGTPSPMLSEDRRAYRNGQNEVLAGINKANREFWAKQQGRAN